MRITLVHNEYARLSGEEVMVRGIARTLRDHGHEVSHFLRRSADIHSTLYGHARALFSGIHSPSAARALERFLARKRPDVVQIQNVYPLISAAAFKVAGRLGIPVVFRCANYRLFCPSGLLLSGGGICDRCVGGKEYWCVLQNCEGSIAKSAGYALRNAWARLSGAIPHNTSIYVVASRFQKRKFAAWGIPANRIAVIPNLVSAMAPPAGDDSLGEYVGYAGRISPEKGLPVLIQALRFLQDVPCAVAGDWAPMPDLPLSAPPNIRFLGPFSRDQLPMFYTRARMIVVPSLAYETFGMVIVEAMLQGRPVIGARIGAIPEVIDDGVTGLLFEPGNADDLADKIRYLWRRPQLGHRMGQAGREKVMREYSPERFYQRLMVVYDRAIAYAKAA